MTQKDKELLLKDLCARLPHGVKVHTEPYGVVTLEPYHLDQFEGLHPIPYLRTMSSMTDEEKRELAEEQKKDEELFLYIIHKSQEGDDSLLGTAIPHYAEDWANKNHFDYRGLIPMGLALEAPEDMYK